LIVKSQYEYARNSFEVRQEERYNEVITFANEFEEAHPESKLLNEVQTLKAQSEEGIKYAQKFMTEQAAQVAKYKSEQAKQDSLSLINKTPVN